MLKIKIIIKNLHINQILAFANGLGDLGSIPGRVVPKTQKTVLDAFLLNTQHYKVQIKGSVLAVEKEAFGSPLTTVANLTLFVYKPFFLFYPNVLERLHNHCIESLTFKENGGQLHFSLVPN